MKLLEVMHLVTMRIVSTIDNLKLTNNRIFDNRSSFVVNSTEICSEYSSKNIEWYIWEIGTEDHIAKYLGCSDMGALGDLSLYSDNDWQLLYEIYISSSQDTTGNGFSVDPSEWKDGLKVPYEIKRNKWGRGIYATEDIAASSIVYDCSNTVSFFEPSVYRYFLKSLPPRQACEVIQWSYIVELNEEEVLDSDFDAIMCLDLDNGSLMNHESTKHNVYYGNSEDGECFIYTERPIKAGEELLIDYSDFTNDENRYFLV
jgi:hypothetical protein